MMPAVNAAGAEATLDSQIICTASDEPAVVTVIGAGGVSPAVPVELDDPIAPESPYTKSPLGPESGLGDPKSAAGMNETEGSTEALKSPSCPSSGAKRDSGLKVVGMGVLPIETSTSGIFQCHPPPNSATQFLGWICKIICLIVQTFVVRQIIVCPPGAYGAVMSPDFQLCRNRAIPHRRPFRPRLQRRRVCRPENARRNRR